jgi:DNA-binding FadR family transcriptional regulator
MRGLGDTIAGQMAKGFRRVTRWAETASRLTEEHRDIAEAIARRREQVAMGLVGDHVERFHAAASAAQL